MTELRGIFVAGLIFAAEDLLKHLPCYVAVDRADRPHIYHRIPRSFAQTLYCLDGRSFTSLSHLHLDHGLRGDLDGGREDFPSASNPT